MANFSGNPLHENEGFALAGLYECEHGVPAQYLKKAIVIFGT